MLKKTLLSAAFFAAMSAYAADIRIAYDADPESMDPQEQLSGGTLQMSHLLFDPLVRHNSKLEIEPRLAEKWEQIDDKTLRFHLRKGVKFHSGREMNVDDVLFTWNRMLTSQDFKGLFTQYEGIKKVDDYTFDVVTKEPYPLVLPNMTYFFVMDKDFYSGTDDKGNDRGKIEKATGTFASHNVSGTGPFKLESRQQGVKSVYVKNPDYWGERGNVDKIELVTIKENATRVSALLAGDVDWIYPVPPTDLERVKGNDKLDLHSLASDRIIFIEMNQNVVEPFKDKRVRQAVVHAVNNPGIVEKIMRGFATPAAQFSPDGYSGYNADLKPRFDLKKAQELMKEAGHEKGFSITMISPNDRYVNDEKIAQSVAAMLAKINIKVELTTMPKAQYWTEFDKCAAGLQLIGWSSDTGDSANYSEFLTMTRNTDTGEGQYNCNGNSHAELDALVKEANATVDEAKRNELLRKVSQIEFDEAFVIPLHWQNQDWGYSKKFENFPDIVNMKNFPLFGDLKVKE
ncbi:MAG: ABC transporter substrate-binding protein [Cardiobacteriaceae bacterium]|nr:ABC transporter substrate-binding protein [Cardiobacteriaceae bacterium]